jgi:hypothetical protein
MSRLYLSQELQDAILELARRPDIRSISCPFDDFHLWEGLFREQVRRAQESSLPPQKALFLAGPDSGIPGVTSPRFVDDEDDGQYPPIADPRTGGLAPDMWGGDVHIPYEGACGGDLFILPGWHNVFPERMQDPHAKLSDLVAGRNCNYLLTHRALGEFSCATRRDLAGWTLYTSSLPHEDCCPMRRRTL